MKTTTLSYQAKNYISMAKEEYKLYSETYNISNLISYEKYRDRLARIMKITNMDADILIVG